MPAFLRKFELLAVPARVAAFLIAGGLLLPWCAEVPGYKLLQVRNMERMWLFPVAAVMLIVAPLLLRNANRAAVTLLVGVAVSIGAGWAAWKLDRMRGPGVWVTLAGGLLALAAGIRGPWSDRAKPDQPPHDAEGGDSP